MKYNLESYVISCTCHIHMISYMILYAYEIWIYYMMYKYDVMLTFHMKFNLKSYLMSYVYNVICDVI